MRQRAMDYRLHGNDNFEIFWTYETASSDKTNSPITLYILII